MKTVSLCILGLVVVLTPTFAFCDSFINGGFETGNLFGWTGMGDALAVGSTFRVAPSGNYQALITNAGFDEGGRPGAYTSLSGHVGVAAFNLPANLSTELGFAPGALNLFAQSVYGQGQNGLAYDGSAIRQSFAGNAGDVVTFRWNYLTNERVPYDLAFVALDTQLILLASYSSATLAVPGVSPPFLTESGYQTFATTLASSGSHTLAVGILNTYDAFDASGLLLDNVSLSSASVPEPSTFILLLTGIGIIGVFRKSR